MTDSVDNGIQERFSALVKNIDKHDYHIFGCGAIGSPVGAELARLGAKIIHLYDGDEVSLVNVGVSEYTLSDINLLKVEALAKKILDINPEIVVNLHRQFVNEHSKLKLGKKSVIILAFDSMESRKVVAKLAIKFKPTFVIDGRMGSEVLQIYNFPKGSTLKEYLATWYPDEVGDPEPCNSKATPYCSRFAGALITNNIKRALMDESLPNSVTFDFKTYGLIIH